MATYSKLTRLSLSWSTSRGQDTYGYSIARLDDYDTKRRFKCMGGGYDMQGTVFGQWLTAEHQDDLVNLFKSGTPIDAGYCTPGYMKLPNLYGVTLSPKGTATCDGACGLSSMVKIAEAIGFEVQYMHNRKGHIDGFLICKVTTP